MIKKLYDKTYISKTINFLKVECSIRFRYRQKNNQFDLLPYLHSLKHSACLIVEYRELNQWYWEVRKKAHFLWNKASYIFVKVNVRSVIVRICFRTKQWSRSKLKIVQYCKTPFPGMKNALNVESAQDKTSGETNSHDYRKALGHDNKFLL